jgi:Spy/CpxP family protein refolding chaperone
MKTRNRHLAAFLAASSIALAVPFAAQARPMMDGAEGCPGPMALERGGHGFGLFGGGHGPRYLRGLDLTEEQLDKVFKLMHDQAPVMRAKMKELQETRSNLEALTRAPSYDEAKVRALTDKAADTMAEVARLRARTEHQIYQLLTPEQRQQLTERQERREERGPGRMHQGPGPGMGPGMRQG